MTVLASTIADKAEIIIQDVHNVRWSEAELLGWINSGCKEAVILKPNAYAVNGYIPLVAGTKQTIGADGIMLIDVIRNVGTSARAITPIERAMLDATIPMWHSMTPSPTVRHFCHDVRDPKTFYVYPPQPTGTTAQVEILRSTVPPTVAALTDPIPLDDIYESVLIDYIIYRSFSKDAEDTGNMQRAATHYQAYTNALTGKLRGEVNFNPQVQFTPTNKGA